MPTAIKTENLSKIYRLGEIGTGTISRDLERWWAKMRGKEDPFLKIGQTNDRSTKGNSNIVYSLRDINFEMPIRTSSLQPRRKKGHTIWQLTKNKHKLHMKYNKVKPLELLERTELGKAPYLKFFHGLPLLLQAKYI